MESHSCVMQFIVPFQAPGENRPALVLGKGSSRAARGDGATEDKKQRMWNELGSTIAAQILFPLKPKSLGSDNNCSLGTMGSFSPVEQWGITLSARDWEGPGRVHDLSASAHGLHGWRCPSSVLLGSGPIKQRNAVQQGQGSSSLPTCSFSLYCKAA